MTHKGIRLRTKIFIYIAGFAAIILLILWLLQVVFLNDFYKSVKANQIKKVADTIISEIDNANLNTYIDELSDTSNYCFRVYNFESGEGFQNISNKDMCGLNMTTDEEMVNLYQDAQENDDQIIKTTNRQEKKLIQSGNGKTTSPFQITQGNFESITLGRIVKNTRGVAYFIVVDGRITPMSETTDTLIEQFKVIAISLVVLTAVMATFIAFRISKPIRKTNENAKRLAKGDFDIHFQGKGYVEIEELNHTLNYAVQELGKVEALRNDLIANMSHDLRTPLTMIGGYAEVIRDLPDENTKENIQVVIDETQRLTNLVNNILDLSKLQSKVETLQISEFNITETLQSITKRFEVMLENDNYNFVIEKEQDVIVKADESRINQVVYNIVGNAIHFTGEDKMIYIRQIIKGDTIRIEIEDTGKGIKAEDLPHVWDRYYKLQSNHKRQQAGSGIGLSIVQGVLEMHKAKYGVVSKEGNGAMFYFELPIAEVRNSK